MPAALSIRERQQIVAMREQGLSFQLIATELKRDYETVRKIYQRYRQSGQLEPCYAACGQQGLRKDQAIYQRALELKAQHPSWGAGLIRVELEAEFAEADLVSERSLQRWFRSAGVQKARRETAPQGFVSRGKKAHEVWAMDAKEQIALGDGSFVSWLTVTDEGTGAILGAFLFPHQSLVANRPPAGEGSAAKSDELLGSSREDPHG